MINKNPGLQVDSPVADGKKGGGPTKKTQAVHKERKKEVYYKTATNGRKR